MTHSSFGPSSSLFASGRAFLQRIGGLVSKVAFGIMVFFAAGIVAIATAMVGLLLAFAALFMKLGFGGRRPAMARARPNAPQNGNVLDARRTARGWTVDQ